MKTDSIVSQNLDEKRARRALFVLGMHRSGTSAITGALRHCGIWVGEEEELTDANIENPLGFWERRDMRDLCDQMLHTAGADWWKVANFDLKTIPRLILTEQSRKFEKIVSALDKYDAWVLKEPRLCLLLPVLRHYINNLVCIHIHRNPLEVARSLQTRNGFSISAGLALWEAYNLYALRASEGLPRISLSYETLMEDPLEALNALVKELEGLGETEVIKPDNGFIERFIDRNLYHQRATEEETEDYLLPSQRALWLRLRTGEAFEYDNNIPISEATRQSLFDLESIEDSFNLNKSRINELEADLSKHDVILKARDERITALENSNSKYQIHLKERTATLRSSEKRLTGLEASNALFKARLEERTKTLREREKRLTALEDLNTLFKTRLEERTTTLKERDAELKKRTAALKAREKTIRELYNSTSWKITAPLRVVSRACRSLAGLSRRSVRKMLWLPARLISRAIEVVRPAPIKSGAQTISQRQGHELEVPARLAKIVRQYRKGLQSKHTVSAGTEAKARISVIAWDLGHNPLGRTYLLADILRHDYDVEIIGANFPRFGKDVWEPLRNLSRVTIKTFPGCNFPDYFKYMEDIAQQIEGDIVYVSKARLPGLELAILAKLHRNRPVILDVDDYEPAFFKNREPLSLKQVKRKRHRPDFLCPHDETWTRYSETLIPMFEALTVSNEELRKKFGGIVLPHIRDEHDFDPDTYPRDALRAELGFTPDDKIILFAGTPRAHKGIRKIVTALESLHRSDYKLLLIGAPVDNETRDFFNKIKPDRIKIIPNTPFCDLPGYLCMGDLICILQDEGQMTSQFQMPAKFTDALSMGIPVLATNVSPLENLAKKGLVETLDGASLDNKLDEIFSNYQTYKRKAIRNREVFLTEYGYGANLPMLRDTIDRLLGNPAPVPDAFHELVAYHRRIFSGLAEAPRITAKVSTAGKPDLVPGSPVVSAHNKVALSPEVKSYLDDKLDIVFFWKQNDTGIYGRRQDMLVKYLAEDVRVNRILHFDAPVNIFKSGHDVINSGQGGRHSHAGLVLGNTIKRRLRLQDRGKIRSDTFIFAGQRRALGFHVPFLPVKEDYLDYVARVMEQQEIGRRRTVFWVCPNKFDFPMLADRFKPDLIVSDVIDDQRKWPSQPQYREKLHDNYEEILTRSHLTIANCHSVFESMSEFTDNIHLIPNACELLEEEARNWKKPVELERIKGPIIGYVGNLDITRIDLQLLTSVATERPDWNLVFIGSMHKSKQIKKLNEFKNVHFLGVRVYEDALRYIRHFDVAMIPHLDNDLTRNMNPLKLYVYFSLHVPVVSTPIANIEDFAEFIQIGGTPGEFVDRVGYCLDNDVLAGNKECIRNILKKNSWSERVKRILTLIEKEFAKRETTDSKLTVTGFSKDGYTDSCKVCGHTGYLRREEQSIRETYLCGNCGASLRYREQARVILNHFSRKDSGCLSDLVDEAEFRNLRIYEPGLIGPFRKYFQKIPGYHSSYFWEEVTPGESRNGIQCQDLMNLTYADNTFDLVLSSDIFEHVRKPFVGFKEINRVLKPGGFHIFSIPTAYPLPPETVYRVDTTGTEDVYVLPKHYHGAPMGGKSLVYTDFGGDIIELMAADGIDLKMEPPCPGRVPTFITERMLTFCWKK